MAEIFLGTDRLLLRRFTAEDEDHLYTLDNDPAVMRYINGGIPTPRTVIMEEILPGFLRYDPHHPGFGFWAAVLSHSGEFLGWFSFRPTGNREDEITLGFRLRQAAWGQGYATEGARALVDKGFRELGVQRVVATTYEDNLASRRVLEKVGLRLVRAFRLAPEDLLAVDTYHVDSLEVWDGYDLAYALEKGEWVRNRSAAA